MVEEILRFVQYLLRYNNTVRSLRGRCL